MPFRHGLTYANVMSTLAVFLALGGGLAWALANDTVKSRHIVDDQVKSADVRDDSLPGGGLGSADIKEEDLALVQGSGRVLSNRMATASAQREAFLEVPGLGLIEAGCAPGQPLLSFWNTTAEPLNLVVDDGGTNPASSVVLDPNVTQGLVLAPGLDRIVFHAGRGVGSGHDLATVTVTSEGGETCVFQAQGIVHSN